MEELFKQWTFWLAAGVEASAGLVIAFAAIEATLQAIVLFVFRRNQPEEAKEALRLRLGRWLAVALEFELAADILRTAIAPTWSEIGQLAAIIVLRTVLNYFLQKEIDKASGRDSANSSLTKSLWPTRTKPLNEPTVSSGQLNGERRDGHR